MEGPFRAFIKTLKKFPSGDEYRLHMQDDITLSHGLKDYLPTAEKMVKDEGWDYLSFYASRRKIFTEQLAKGQRVAKAPVQEYCPLLCTILSPRLVALLLKHEQDFDQNNRADDMYLASVLKAYKIPAYFHLPSLAQHNIAIPSSIGFVNNTMRTSIVYDHNFVAKWKQSNNLT